MCRHLDDVQCHCDDREEWVGGLAAPAIDGIERGRVRAAFGWPLVTRTVRPSPLALPFVDRLYLRHLIEKGRPSP